MKTVKNNIFFSVLSTSVSDKYKVAKTVGMKAQEN